VLESNYHILDAKNYYVFELITQSILENYSKFLTKSTGSFHYTLCDIEGCIIKQSHGEKKYFLKIVRLFGTRFPKKLLLSLIRGVTPDSDHFEIYVLRNRHTKEFQILYINQKVYRIRSIEEYKRTLESILNQYIDEQAEI
jgi:hypothetical protein